MPKLHRLYLIIALFSFVYSNESRAYFRTAYWWVSAYSMPRPSANKGGVSPMGVGITFEYLPIRQIGIETGAIIETHYLNSVVSQHVIAPLMFRFWPTERFTVGAGAYYDYQLTNLPLNLLGQNYGLRGIVGLNFPIGKERAQAMAVEVGYQYGYANQSIVPGANFYESQLLFNVGFRFGKDHSTSTPQDARGRIPSLNYIPPPGSY